LRSWTSLCWEGGAGACSQARVASTVKKKLIAMVTGAGLMCVLLTAVIMAFVEGWYVTGSGLVLLMASTAAQFFSTIKGEAFEEPKQTGLLGLHAFAVLLLTCGVVATLADPYPVLVGGCIENLAGTGLTLKNGDQTVTVNGGDVKCAGFAFPNKVAEGSSYSVSIAQQAEGSLCKLSHASGSATTDVMDLALDCEAAWTVGGHLKIGESEEPNPVTVYLNRGQPEEQSMKLETTQDFTFPSPLKVGTNYDVSTTGHAGTCAIGKQQGQIGNAAVTDVHIVCS